MNATINTQAGMLIWVNYDPKEKSDTKTLNNIYPVLNRLKQALKSILNIKTK